MKLSDSERDLNIEEYEKQRALRTLEIVKELKDLYSRTDQAIFHILQRFDEVSKDVIEHLDDESRVVFHSRYEALSAYLRHYRLGDKCLLLEGDFDC